MAFATQRQFLNIAFANEMRKLPDKKRSDAVVKSYESCSDTRAWSLDAQKQSQFLGDVAIRAWSAARQAPLHSFSGAELTKEMLERLDAGHLADYTLSLREELRQKNVTIDALQKEKEKLTDETKLLNENLRSLDETNRQLVEEIDGIIRHQERQREAIQFDEQEMAEISQMIIDLRERNEALEAEATEFSTGVDHVGRLDLEAENSFLKFKAQDYDRLENELILFKAECESLTQQKRELALEIKRTHPYRARAVELEKGLQEEERRREMLEEQIEMLVTMYDQQAVELHHLKDQLRVHSRGPEERIFDESTEASNESKITLTESSSQTEANERALDSVEPTSCQNCSDNLRHIEELKEQVEFLQQELTNNEARDATLDRVDSNETVLHQQIEDLQRDLADCRRQLEEATEKYTTLRETSLADCQELGRLKLQLEQITNDAPVVVAVDQAELIESNEKVKSLQSEKENLQNELANAQNRIKQLEKSLQNVATSAPLGTADCCVQKENKITELELVISELQDVPPTVRKSSTVGGLVALREENASLQQIIASLQRELEDHKTVPDDQLTPLREELRKKDETIEQLLQKLDGLEDVVATSAPEERACREELVELRARLEAFESGGDGRRSRKVSARSTINGSDHLEPLSSKEQLGDAEEEKETAEIKHDPVDDEAEENDLNPQARMSESMEKLEGLAYDMKQATSFEQNSARRSSFVDGKCSPGMRGASRDCECIQRIALKIAEDGLEGLLVAEMYVLLQEICGAITRRNAVLGRNVTVLANSMTKCWQVITDARVMMNMELMDRSNHRQQLVRHAGIVADLDEDDDNRLSYDIGHLKQPPVSLHRTRSVCPDDNRQMAPSSVGQRHRSIRWMDNVKKPSR